MIRIEQLRLVLPHDLAPHAAEFARRVGEALAAAAERGELQGTGADRLRVGPVQLAHGAGLERAASEVAAGVVRTLARRDR